MSFVDSKVRNKYAKFQVWILHSKRDLYVQKIKVKKSIFRYIFYYLTSSFSSTIILSGRYHIQFLNALKYISVT